MKKVASLLVYSILLALIAASIAYGRANNTTTTVSSGNNPSCSAQSVTFTATVSKTGGPGNPTGTVTFKNGGTTMGDGTRHFLHFLADGGGTFDYCSLRRRWEFQREHFPGDHTECGCLFALYIGSTGEFGCLFGLERELFRNSDGH